MDEYSHRQEVLVRIAELLEQMPEDVLLQLIQGWEAELTEILTNDPNLLNWLELEFSPNKT